MRVDDAKDVSGRSKWKAVVSDYPDGKGCDVYKYVCFH